MDNVKSKITAIKTNRNPKIQRSNVFLDGKLAFSLDNEAISQEALKIGQELSPAEVNLLTKAGNFQRCLNAALQFLSYRPRSEAETRARLQRRGFETEEIEKAITQLHKLELLNDTAFAEFWTENRQSFRPRSQAMLRLELRRKGVNSEVINGVVQENDDRDNAYRAALKKARTLPLLDYQVFRRRLSGYLQRRGFNYSVINNTVKQAWEEQRKDSVQNSDLKKDSGL